MCLLNSIKSQNPKSIVDEKTSIFSFSTSGYVTILFTFTNVSLKQNVEKNWIENKKRRNKRTLWMKRRKPKKTWKERKPKIPLMKLKGSMRQIHSVLACQREDVSEKQQFGTRQEKKRKLNTQKTTKLKRKVTFEITSVCEGRRRFVLHDLWVFDGCNPEAQKRIGERLNNAVGKKDYFPAVASLGTLSFICMSSFALSICCMVIRPSLFWYMTLTFSPLCEKATDRSSSSNNIVIRKKHQIQIGSIFEIEIKSLSHCKLTYNFKFMHDFVFSIFI